MRSLHRPTDTTLRAFLAAQGRLGFTYTAVGATAGEPPPGYRVDHNRVKLGEGEGVYTRARAALERWDQFRLGWVEVWPQATPIRPGEIVAIVARRYGIWWVNACRIIYVVDEPGSDAGPGRLNRYGLAYGTLPDHAGTGEERFLVEWDRTTGEVWYDILAFSRPHWLLTRLGYRFMRRLQKRFGRDSAAAIVKAVGNTAGEHT